jgi:hypothetical protein
MGHVGAGAPLRSTQGRKSPSAIIYRALSHSSRVYIPASFKITFSNLTPISAHLVRIRNSLLDPAFDHELMPSTRDWSCCRRRLRRLRHHRILCNSFSAALAATNLRRSSTQLSKIRRHRPDTVSKTHTFNIKIPPKVTGVHVRLILPLVDCSEKNPPEL